LWLTVTNLAGPANIYGAGRAMLDLNRLGAEVAAINTARPRVVDLLTGELVDLNAIRAEPMLPRLLQINTGRGL